MARKHRLRKQRVGTVLDITSKKQESDVIKALFQVEKHLHGKFAKKTTLVHEKQWLLKDIPGN